MSVVRGRWEVRLVRVEDASPQVRALRVSGWAVAGAAPSADEDPAAPWATASSGTLVSAVAGRVGLTSAGVAESRDASPLGDVARTPWLEGPVRTGEWSAAVVGLWREPGPGEVPPHAGPPVAGPRDAGPRVEVAAGDHPPSADVTWPDGVRTRVALPEGGDRG